MLYWFGEIIKLQNIFNTIDVAFCFVSWFIYFGMSSYLIRWVIFPVFIIKVFEKK